jgi:RecA/RadA recombinase
MDHGFSQTQKMGGLSILIDTEETRDMAFSRQIGVDVDKLQIIQFERNMQTVEHVFETIATTIDFWAERFPEQIVAIGWDSVAMTSTQDELDGDVGESHGARPAQMLKRGMRRIVPKLAGTNIVVILANHQYVDVGGMGYGPKKKKVYGGSGIAYGATLRLEMFRFEQLKDTQGVVVGNKIGVRVWKTKTSKNWNVVAELGMMHGIGIDNVWTIFDEFSKRGIITSGGGWYAMQLEGEPVMRWQGQWGGLGELCLKNEGLFERLVRIYNALE